MRSRYLWPAAVLALGTVLVACGDDDTAPEAADDSPSTETTDAGIGQEACDAVLAVGEALLDGPDGPPTPEYLEGQLQPTVDAVADSGVEELTGPAADLDAAIDAALAGDDESAEEQAFAAYGAMAEVTHDGCGYETADVTAVDYAFTGLPESLPAGMTSFALANEGAEEHELVLVRRAEGETRPVEELVELPDAEAEEALDFLGFTFAAPGETSYLPADLEAGDYIAICFLPVGGGEDGPPHFTEGMVTEFEVA